MSEEIKNQGFGITEELQSTNTIPFKPGIQKGLLVDVKSYNKESKKGEKYDVLEFKFVDLNNEASYDKIEFAVDRAEDINAKGVRGGKEKALNIRVKHIYEIYSSLPKGGLGHGATSWANYFDLIAEAFNKNGKDSTPIYKSEGKYIPVWLKFTYYNNNLGFPYSPNFIEKYKDNKESNLFIDKNYESIEQTTKNKNAPASGSVFGGVSTSSGSDDYNEFMSSQ